MESKVIWRGPTKSALGERDTERELKSYFKYPTITNGLEERRMGKNFSFNLQMSTRVN